ncbi:MocR-like pyridoxine biosynthesis transcription factor PdxR [Aquibacillus rhizosphaerae]|uniref:PLP-dependent aminotransferase family protein n=1 Tax=Aquibacillus rhizosphaerae TaxID=3051431 RepID=A0ABT7L766_9BACI|nr:PLP-dependent aminotransferase family protein [Aquibacillus sp. LR5S19]MDL4841234.1 PLP-dependent aminotransferase family protein [Aquibacillus sp. LR5S19]
MIEITPLLENKNGSPIYLQLYNYIKQEIERGRYQANEKLPSIRKLALYLDISQNTVESSYQQLLAEGYIESVPKRGFYIQQIDEELSVVKRHKPFPLAESDSSFEKVDYHIDFHQASIDLALFPISEWKKCSNEVLHNRSIFDYGHPQGEMSLREQLAYYLHFSRGVNCTPEQIVVGAGTQQLLGMLCLIFKQCESSIAIENPGYKGAKDVFLNHGLDVEPIRVEADGISVNELKKSKNKIVYITPSHQYPTGVITSITKRRQLLKWAIETEGYILEDDYDSEFRYVGRPIPSLQGLDLNERVIYLGTFSKSFSPALRVSYMVLPKSMLNQYKKMYASYDQTVSKIHQEALALFIERGYLTRHIRRIRKLNRQKREVLLKAISKYMGMNVNVVGEKSGVYILLEIKLSETEETLIQLAKKAKIRVYPTSPYWTDYRSIDFPKIQLGFGGLNEVEIKEGIYLLSKIWFK